MRTSAMATSTGRMARRRLAVNASRAGTVPRRKYGQNCDVL